MIRGIILLIYSISHHNGMETSSPSDKIVFTQRRGIFVIYSVGLVGIKKEKSMFYDVF